MTDKEIIVMLANSYQSPSLLTKWLGCKKGHVARTIANLRVYGVTFCEYRKRKRTYYKVSAASLKRWPELRKGSWPQGLGF